MVGVIGVVTKLGNHVGGTVGIDKGDTQVGISLRITVGIDVGRAVGQAYVWEWLQGGPGVRGPRWS